MSEIIDFMVSARVMDLAADPRVLFGCAALFIVAVLLRWKLVLISMFGVGAVLAVARYTGLSEGRVSMDSNLLLFSIGTFMIGIVLIYFLFIRGD